MDPLSLLSLPGWVLRWLGAQVGITDAPNIELQDWKTVETAEDPRLAWYHWVHVRCVNEQRGGISKRFRTQTAIGCHARVDFVGEHHSWWDNVPFTTGGPQPAQTVDLIAGDRRHFIPLFLNLPSPVPDPRGGPGTIGPGLFPTGNQFFGGLTKKLPAGSYNINVRILQGDRLLKESAPPNPVITPPFMAPLGIATPMSGASPSIDAHVSEVIGRASSKQRTNDVVELLLNKNVIVEEPAEFVTIPITLTWGGSGAWFQAVSNATAMLNVRFILIDARWLSSSGYWVTTSDTHPGGHFEKLQTARRDLHPEESVSVGSIQNETVRLSIQGSPLQGGGVAHCRMRKAGKWRLEFQLEDATGRTAQRFLCFQWDADGKFQQPLEPCPEGKPA